MNRPSLIPKRLVGRVFWTMPCKTRVSLQRECSAATVAFHEARKALPEPGKVTGRTDIRLTNHFQAAWDRLQNARHALMQHELAHGCASNTERRIEPKSDL